MADPSGSASARGYAATLLTGLLSALTITVGVAKPWVTANATVTGMPRLTVSVIGADLAPLAGAMGFVLLAAFGAVLATRGVARRAVGVVILVASLVVVWAAAHPGGGGRLVGEALRAKGWTAGDYESSTVAWRWVVFAAAMLCAGAGALVVSLGPGWATMGERYDAPATQAPDDVAPTAARRAGSTPSTPSTPSVAPVSEVELWRALDRGHDPTAET